jgi:hypothetical protein
MRPRRRPTPNVWDCGSVRAVGSYCVRSAGGGVARSVVNDRVMHGLALGVLAAALDIALLLAAGASVTLLSAMSNVGRIAAGTLGGWLASYRQESFDGNV